MKDKITIVLTKEQAELIAGCFSAGGVVDHAATEEFVRQVQAGNCCVCEQCDCEHHYEFDIQGDDA